MADVLTRIINLTVQGNQAERELKKVNKSLDTIGGSLNKVGGLAKTAFAALGVGLTGSFLKSVIETNSALAKQADAVGFNVEKFQEYQYAAKIGGVENASFSSSMTALAKRIGELRNQTGPLFGALQKYDKTLIENIKNTRTQDEALKLLADRIQNAETATEKAFIANAAFSREGINLVNVLNQGSQGLDEMGARARDLGLVMSERLIRNSELFDDKLFELNQRIKTTFGIEFLNVLSFAMDEGKILFIEFFAFVDKDWLQFQRDIKIGWEFIKTAFITGITGITLPFITLLKLTGKFSPEVKKIADAIPTPLKALEDFKGKVAELNKEFEDGAALIDKNKDDLIDFTRAENEVRDATARLAKIQGEFTGVIEETADAQDDFIKKTIQGAIDFDKSIGQNQKAMEALAEALRLGVITAEAYKDSMNKLGVDLDKNENFINSFIDSANNFDLEESLKPIAIERLNEAFEKGEISEKAYRIEMEKIKGATKDLKKETISLDVAIGETLANSVDSLANAFIDFAKGGRDAFKQFAQSVLQDIAKLIIKYQILQTVQSFGFGAANGAAFDNGVQFFASGGVVNSPTLFGMANGGVGVMGEAGPEAILPLRRGESGNLGVEASVNVNVKNYATGVAVSTGQDQNGEIEIIIQQIADKIRTGGNKLTRSLEGVYGVNRSRGAT